MYPSHLETHQQNTYSFKTSVQSRYFISDEDVEKILVCSYYHHDDFPILMHSHMFYEINIITDGYGRHYIEDNNFPAYTGDVFIIPPDLKHGYYEESNLKIFHILLSEDFMKIYSEILNNIHGYSLLFNIEPKLRAKGNRKLFPSISKTEFGYYLNEINKLNNLNYPITEGAEVSKSLKVLNLICDFATLLTSNKLCANKDIYIDTTNLLRVISNIEKNYASNITIEELCNIANMSRSTLLKQFSALCDCSPKEYLTNVRIENACNQLITTNSSVADIAQDCGFFDSSHFSKSFFEKMNVLPKEYRKSNTLK